MDSAVNPGTVPSTTTWQPPDLNAPICGARFVLVGTYVCFTATPVGPSTRSMPASRSRPKSSPWPSTHTFCPA